MKKSCYFEASWVMLNQKLWDFNVFLCFKLILFRKHIILVKSHKVFLSILNFKLIEERWVFFFSKLAAYYFTTYYSFCFRNRILIICKSSHRVIIYMFMSLDIDIVLRIIVGSTVRIITHMCMIANFAEGCP